MSKSSTPGSHGEDPRRFCGNYHCQQTFMAIHRLRIYHGRVPQPTAAPKSFTFEKFSFSQAHIPYGDVDLVRPPHARTSNTKRTGHDITGTLRPWYDRNMTREGVRIGVQTKQLSSPTQKKPTPIRPKKTPIGSRIEHTSKHARNPPQSRNETPIRKIQSHPYTQYIPYCAPAPRSPE
jgi:hypothetical protein